MRLYNYETISKYKQLEVQHKFTQKESYENQAVSKPPFCAKHLFFEIISLDVLKHNSPECIVEVWGEEDVLGLERIFPKRAYNIHQVR